MGNSNLDAGPDLTNDHDDAVPLRVSVARADPGRRLAALRRMALICALLVLAITSLSAFIRLSKAGLSCTDWPRCYGQNMRELQQGLPTTAGEGDATAAARLAHRLVASSALLLAVTMVMVCLAARPLLWREGRAALALLALALFLAVLGRWSSNARVPAVVIGNLLGGFAMLALCWRLARRDGVPGAPWLRAWAGLGVALVACQVALGGLLSASYAATSCAGLVDCIAAAGGVPWNVLDPWREPVLASTPPHNASSALVLVAHRLSGLATVTVLLPLGLAMLGLRRSGAGTLLIALLATQAGLGLLMAGNSESLALAMGHNIVAALLLAALLELTRGSGAPPRA